MGAEALSVNTNGSDPSGIGIFIRFTAAVEVVVSQITALARFRLLVFHGPSALDEMRDLFQAPGEDNPTANTGPRTAMPDSSSLRSDSLLVRNRGGGMGGAARKVREDRQQAEMDAEAYELPPEELAPVEEKPEEEELAVLSNPKWTAPDTLFHQESEVSVQLTLPPGKEKITKVEAELIAKLPTGEKSIWKGEGHPNSNGTAVISLPVYKPDGYQGGPVDYFVRFTHKLAKILNADNLLRSVSEAALKSLDHALIPGIAFDKDTSFISPKAASGLKALEGKFKEWEGKYPKNAQIAVFGHAEMGEKDAKVLSERRARSAFAFLSNDAAAWEALYNTEKWGLKPLQILLKDLGHYNGSPDGTDGPRTQGAFTALQKKSGLPETGNEDAATRKALFAAYMKGKHDIQIDASRFCKVTGNPWMGCTHNNRTKDGESAAPENRRVAFILLNPSKFFPIHFPCQVGNEAGCQAQCKRPGTRSKAGIKCLFYDELVRENKQIEEAEEESTRQKLPWLVFAEKEAKRWKGKTEDEISKTINYHKEVGIGIPDLSGTDHAWCASFLNYCLKQSGYEMSNPACRARSVSEDPNFVKIEKPIFGAIAMIGTYHVGFVYATDSKSEKPILLGGNQSDQINFSVFYDKATYYLPKLFDPSKYEVPQLPASTVVDLNSEFGITNNEKKGDNTR